MKSPWFLWIAGLLGGTAAATERTSPSTPRGEAPPAAVTTRKPAAPAPATPADPFAPFRIDDHQTIPPQPDMLRDGRQASGSGSGPVNTEEPDRDFFTDPRFDHGGNSGRLFYHQTFLRNPHDPFIPERRAWFICWSPLDDGARAQRLHERPGFLIGEVTTDGKAIHVHHLAYVGDQTHIDTMRWTGDALGHGRFELVGIVPVIPEMSAPTDFDRHRDRGYALLSARNWTEAADAFEAALRSKPNDAATLFALGVAWEGLTPREPAAAAKAIDAYGRALGSDPRRSPAHQHRANLFAQQDQPGPAIQELTQLLALEPEAWEPRLERARLHARADDYPKAIDDAREAHRKAPIESAPLEALARYEYRSGHWTDAISTGRRLLAIDDSRSAIRVTMACAQAQLGQASEALQTYADARANGVSNPERQWGIRELENWIRKAPKDAPALAAVRRLLQQLRGPDQLEAAERDSD